MHFILSRTHIIFCLKRIFISELRLCCVSRCDKRPTSLPVVVEGRHVLRIDTTVAKNLALLLSDLTARDQPIIFWNWCEDAKQTLISYDPSLATYCRSSGSLAHIFSGKISVSRFVAYSYNKNLFTMEFLEIEIDIFFFGIFMSCWCFFF